MDRQALRRRLCSIRHKILVLSGKGGVGKSTVTINLAAALARDGKRVGVLDADVHGPSIPKMLRLEDTVLRVDERGIVPAVAYDLKVMSIGFMLRSRDDPVIWRGPRKSGAIKQLIRDVDWGDLDFLVIDLPPGTGDEPLSVCQLIEDADGGVVVTTPQDIAVVDVRKAVSFCKELELPVLGVVENMSGFVCPKCGTVTEIYKKGGGERMAREMGVPFLGSIPIDPGIGAACDEGTPYVGQHAETETSRGFDRLIGKVLSLSQAKRPSQAKGRTGKNGTLRLAVPIAEGRLSTHFGHCERFALVDVDTEAKHVLKKEMISAPDHQPGLLPRWLAERGADVVIAGGMGRRAQDLFAEQSIEVVVGAPSESLERIVAQYLRGTLKIGENVCDH
jgi:Mrp family chromosome partitioning ATPase/predicted Fe-Mo cluster-binding NifX family protein